MRSIFTIADIDIHDLRNKIKKIFQHVESPPLDDFAHHIEVLSIHQKDPADKYYEILTAINDFLIGYRNQKSFQAISSLLEALLNESLSEIAETKFKVDQIDVKAALFHLKQSLATDADLYDSIEHQRFCQRWRVSGELADYAYWHEMNRDLNYNLDHRNYGLLIETGILRFNIPTKRSIVNPDSRLYDQPGLIQIKQIIKPEVYDQAMLKRELDIWRADNLLQILINYLVYFFQKNDDLNMLENKASEIKNHVLIPLWYGFINPARLMLALPEYSEQEKNNMIELFDIKFLDLKVKISRQEKKINVPLALKTSTGKLNTIPKIDIPLTNQKKRSFSKNHPVLLATLKGLGVGVGVSLLIAATALLMLSTGGGAGILFAAMIHAIGLKAFLGVSVTASMSSGAVYTGKTIYHTRPKKDNFKQPLNEIMCKDSVHIPNSNCEINRKLKIDPHQQSLAQKQIKHSIQKLKPAMKDIALCKSTSNNDSPNPKLSRRACRR